MKSSVLDWRSNSARDAPVDESLRVDCKSDARIDLEPLAEKLGWLLPFMALTSCDRSATF
jgi:hypothetical protein